MGGRDGLAMDVDMPSFAAENLGGGKWSGICHGAGVRVPMSVVYFVLVVLLVLFCVRRQSSGWYS